MNLKVNGQFLDFNGEIDVEKKIKLFEEISTTDGDVSFAFDVPRNPHNMKILGFPMADVANKPIYVGLPCDIINFGNVLYSGLLRVESVTNVISCSFIAGNANWFALITGNLFDLDFSEFNEELTVDNIIASWARTEGVKYPIVDSGVMLNRPTSVFIIEDFVPFIYVKTVFQKIFQRHGIKIQGELITDPIYNNLVVSANNQDIAGIVTRSTYAGKEVTQDVGDPDQVITFPVETDPFFDGTENLWNGQRYTADVKMVVDVAVTFEIDYAFGVPPDPHCKLYLNSDVLIDGLADEGTTSISATGVILNPGDYLELIGETFSTGKFSVLSGSFRVTPRIVYYTYSTAALPNWTQQQFVSNILRLFNIIAAYEPVSKTITFNLFERIKDKTPVDISQWVKPTEINFERFVGNYSKRNLLVYQQPSIDDVETYNKQHQYEYGTGVIEVNNTFLDEENEIVESDFSVPFGYISTAFNMHLEKININELQTIQSFNVTTVTDSSGLARLDVGSDHGFDEGDLVTIEDSTILSYNGTYVVIVSGSNYIECSGLRYLGDADLTAKQDIVVRSSNDDVFLMIDSGPWDIEAFSQDSAFRIIDGGVPDLIMDEQPSFAFFNLLNTGSEVNDFFKTSLSFGDIDDQLSYQRTMIDVYWRLFTDILNDPVSPTLDAYLPLSTFLSIDFLAPIFIKTNNTSNLYYANRITGYKSQKTPCEIELIKL